MAPARMVVTDGFTLNPGDNPWDELGTWGHWPFTSGPRRPS